MSWLRITEIALGLVIVLFCITQLVIPAWRGQKLFPRFRKQGKLESELADVIQANEEKDLTQAINEMKNYNPMYFFQKGAIWYYEDPAYPIANVKGRGETKAAAYRHWQLLTKVSNTQTQKESK